MRQRLGLAAALLGDPRVLILDEPANGLDPAGIAWLRGLLRTCAARATVLVSSHVLAEVAQTVDDIVIIARGRLVEQGAMDDLHGAGSSLVRTTDAEALLVALRPVDVAGDRAARRIAAGHHVGPAGSSATSRWASGLPVHELRLVSTDLESLFFSLTESTGGDPDSEPPPAAADGTA